MIESKVQDLRAHWATGIRLCKVNSHDFCTQSKAILYDKRMLHQRWNTEIVESLISNNNLVQGSTNNLMHESMGYAVSIKNSCSADFAKSG